MKLGKKIDELIDDYNMMLNLINHSFSRGWIDRERYMRERKELQYLIQLLRAKRLRGEKYV